MFFRFLGAHARHRLVEKHEPGAGGKRQAHFERALLAVRERGRDDSLAPGESDFAGDRSRFVEKRRLCRDRPPEREARAAPRLHRQRKVVEHGKALEHAGDLIAAREAGVHPVVLRGARDVPTLEKGLRRHRCRGCRKSGR